MRYKAPAKLWIANGGKTLVADGHPDACALFSRAGQDHDELTLFRFSNWREAFGLEIQKEIEKQSQDADPVQESSEQTKNDRRSKRNAR